MMRKLLAVVLLTCLLLVMFVPVAAAQTEPVAGCPNGFELHPVEEEHEHTHHHAGTSADQNGDGWICVKHVTPTEKVHVHIDNTVK